ncbi:MULTISPECIES: M9 family metallopeptidase [unclassified Janthinobacterium]|uniref:M9 family metallopeptidase n=1 Tax=unclassified Janthinobacterium TaxID=2610881 RepID=UPI0005648736|nr:MULTISPECIES: M9 family metallopeptidase [unclassified Janthinobacterium]MEC5163254.1 microbial collagenase [Janthinobacterium sp. CG_S6]
MHFHSKSIYLAGLIAACLSPVLHAAGQAVQHADDRVRLTQAPQPRERQTLPPSVEQSQFNLSKTAKPRLDLLTPEQRNKSQRALAAPPECQDMNKLASYSGAALADYLVSLPDYECHYGLFSLSATQAAQVYSAANFSAVASRFAQEAAAYSATNIKLVNVLIYLRAGYYLAEGGTLAMPSPALLGTLRAPLKQLIDGNKLFTTNTSATSTAGETLKLVNNMHDEPYFLPSLKNLVLRYTNTSANPTAADALKQASAGGGFTGALSAIFYAHFRSDGVALLQNDPSYATALNNFAVNNKAALLSSAAYQLHDAASEAFRFMQYSGLKASVKPMVKSMLASSTMLGADSTLWLAAASAVKYYDNANCAEYGTCNYTATLANAVLKNSYTCSPTLRVRAQDMTTAQLQDSCARLQTEESYFHAMLQTKQTPVANDNNTALELVVFDDYSNYSKYAGIIYDIDTNNGGMYLEGNPGVVGNQARFIAHEASWLRPSFQVWNLEHEYVHYLDGRFNMYGDFGAGVSKPTVWWIEGIGEYLSYKNNNQASIDVARGGAYRLSQIFGNTYQMSDYQARAYRWGYMATRFMMERHRADIDPILAKFRVGDYAGYQTYMDYIGTRYDTEFASWAGTATTAGEPPMPADPLLPECPSTSYLGKNCSIRNLSSSTQAYVFLMLPAGAKNVKVSTSGGTGDVDLYQALDRYPTISSYDVGSANAGNRESVAIGSPVAGRWYYVMLKAKQPFSGVNVSATYD